jgi:hypothetical protein
MAVNLIQKFRRPTENSLSWRAVVTRGLRIGVLALVFYGLNDIMAANSPLYRVDTQTTSFAAVYPSIRDADDDPFPAVNLPHAPNAFEVYEAELRNWGVNEGWIPNSADGLLSWEAGTLTNLPRWAIVSNAYGGASQDYAQRLVDGNGPYEPIKCYKLENFEGDPCRFDGMSAVLYERDDVLPYAFVVPADALLNLPGKLNGNTVFPAHVVAHQQDTISIQAERPPVPGEYYLVVQENHFPGWKASADGITLQTQAAQYYRDILTGDRGFIAVLMPEGAQDYRFWFEPPGLLVGIVVTLGTVGLIGWYAVSAKYRVLSSE